jgi:hypothetical protein
MCCKVARHEAERSFVQFKFDRLPFNVRTEFSVATGKRGEHPIGMSLITRMQELEASRRGNRWYPRVYRCGKKRAPCPPLFEIMVAREGWLLEREEHRARPCLRPHASPLVLRRHRRVNSKR